MSLASQISLLAERVGGEVKIVHTGIASIPVIVVEISNGVWSNNASSRILGDYPIVFIGTHDPADITYGIGSPGNINPTDTWLKLQDNGIITEAQVTGLIADLAAKASLADPTFTGIVNGITKSMVGLTNVDDTSDINKPVSTAQANNDNLRLLASAAPTTTIVGIADSQTLTNKRITPRENVNSSSATPTPNADTNDVYILTAQAIGCTFGAPTGTPVDCQKLLIRIRDNGTARSLAYNSVYRAIGMILPTTTIINKLLYLGFMYNSIDSKWDCIAVGQEA